MKFFLSSCRSSITTPRRRLAIGLAAFIVGVQLVLLYLGGRFENEGLLRVATMVMPVLATLPIWLVRGGCKSRTLPSS